MKFTYPEGATPLTSEDPFNLIPQHITTQKDLDEWEHMNILRAQQWAFRKHHKNLITTAFMQTLHKHMFAQTWKWAGTFRKHQTNIGCPWTFIHIELKKLCDDVRHQLKESTYSPVESAVRLHHRLVLIHPFPNGNGRFSRLMVDLLLANLGEKRLTWGHEILCGETHVRRQYIEALRKADQGDFADLIKFSQN